jgi:hypothetical protein
LLIEAIGTGVCRLALGQTAARRKENVRLLRLKLDVPLAPFVAQAAANRGHQYLSRGYSVSGAVGTKIASLRDKNRGDLFCSQLVARAYEEAGCSLVPGKFPEDITPADISNSPLLRDVTDLALVSVTVDEPPGFYLDDASHFKRPIHWEVETKLSILRSDPVVKELARIGRNPESFFELEKVLRTTRSLDLDRVINDHIKLLRFKESYIEKTLNALGVSNVSVIFENGFAWLSEPRQEELTQCNDNTLTFLIEMAKSDMLSFENDVKSRKNDIETWLRYRTPYNEQTFAYLTDLQQQLLLISEQFLTLNKQRESALLDEQRRRSS